MTVMRKIIIVSVVGLLLFVALPLIFFNPRVQIEIYVHETERNPSGNLLTSVIGHFLAPYLHYKKPMPASMLNALVGMSSDRDPKVRDLALRIILAAAHTPGNEKTFFALPGIRERLKKLVDDPDDDTATHALMLLGLMKDKENTGFFREVLKNHASDEEVIAAAIRVLSETNDPGTLDDILPFVRDSRPYISSEAINNIRGYDDQRVLDVFSEILPTTAHSSIALSAMTRFSALFPKHNISAQMDPALLAGSRNKAIPTYDRIELPDAIMDTQMKVEARENILLFPSADHPVECQIEAASALGIMESDAAGAVPSLEKVLNDPATDPNVRAEVEKALKKIRQ